MKTFTSPFLKIVVLTLILSAVLTVKFIVAWTGPTATAPNQNVAAPINVGTSYQAKSEGIGATYFRSDNYCNAAGTTCLTIDDNAKFYGGAYTTAGANCEGTNPLTSSCSCPSTDYSVQTIIIGGASINICYL